MKILPHMLSGTKYYDQQAALACTYKYYFLWRS